jgi:hypothetical protein
VGGLAECSGCPDNVFLVADKPDLAQGMLIVEQPIIGVAALAGGVFVLAQRWQRATAASRRAVAPVLASGGLCLLVLVLTVFVEPFSYEGGQIIGWVGGFAFTAVPLAFLAGLARSRLDRVALGDLVVELGQTPPPKRLRDVLAHAIHDPSLEIAYAHVLAHEQDGQTPRHGPGNHRRRPRRHQHRVDRRSLMRASTCEGCAQRGPRLRALKGSLASTPDRHRPAGHGSLGLSAPSQFHRLARRRR